ncbi:MAG: dephospho-CoA kinase [Pseudomonadota bacterium]|nr:dephospho-CoA kinase [Pseudomonadota bacterium]
MPVVAVTGGIAVGKTVMMRYWSSKYEFPIFDTDDIGRDLLLTHEIKKNIRHIFGSKVFDAEEEVDRLSIQRRIFSNSEEKRALESLLHPHIRRVSQEKIHAFLKKYAYCLVVVPLLYETNTAKNYDRVCLVESALDQRVRRCFDRGLSEDVTLAIMHAQASSQQRISVSDDVLYNVQDFSFFYKQIDDLYRQYGQQFL